jgi:16S rRNA (uracil1498-N3)-methyltransferase
MSRRRCFVPKENIRNGIARPARDQIHHLLHVLRLKGGDEIEVFDGEGFGALGRIDISEAGVCIRLEGESLPAGPPHAWVTLAPALIKTSRFEWLLQKAVELGANEIIPLETRYCDVRLGPDRMQKRAERWERIVREASGQSRRLFLPKLHPPILFDDFLARQPQSGSTRLLLYEKAEAPMIPEAALTDRIEICTGPEGGWHPSEVEQARQSGYQAVSLGPCILRAETAALASLAVVGFMVHRRKGGIGQAPLHEIPRENT